MNRKPLAGLIPQLARSFAPTTAVATAMISPLAQAASGDLDPAFGEVGRLGPIAELKGEARSLEILEDGSALLGGGVLEAHCHWYFCYYDPDFEASNFIGALTEVGGIDASYHAAAVTDVEVFDIARQADGKVVAAGRRVGRSNASHNLLVIFRLEPEGSIDAGFGSDGIFELDSVLFGNHNQANALVVDPDGRIVIAGARDDALMVLRLNADGTLDDSFGSGGVFSGPAHDYFAGSRIARTSAGAYRVTTADASGCRVMGLTASGAVDDSYGDAGSASVATAFGNATACHAIAAQSDDRLLIAGLAGGQAFAARLLANGAPDPAFAGTDVASVLADATAIAIADDGRILVGGDGVRGATVMRLQATGQLDPLFGDAGATTIDLPSEFRAYTSIQDLSVWADGSVIAAGGHYESYPARPFAVRLLGDAGGDSPGVLSIEQSDFQAAEASAVVVTVRRTGGSSGPVSVGFSTASGDGSASGGQDYEDMAGRLDWADGDTGERTITVPVLEDAGAPEEYENFRVALADAQGGAGIGTRNASVTIQPDGSPAGQFALDASAVTVSEFGAAQIWVYRNYYVDGAVSVTVTPVAGTAAAGDDFRADSVTVSWADQDIEAKLVEIPIVDDQAQEAEESFSLQLSDPTGGAIIGPRASQTITIAANDQQRGGGGGGGGGGAAGFLSLLLLGIAELFRSVRRSLQHGA